MVSDYNLEKWIRREHLVDVRKKKGLKSISEKPFRHAVLDSFFLDEVYEELAHYCNSIPLEKAHNNGLAAKAFWRWGALSNIEFLKFFYSREFKMFLSVLAGEEVLVNTQSIPQFNLFLPGSGGIPVHTDNNSGTASFVTLLQMTDDAEPCDGGDFIFYEEIGTKVVEFRRIKPKKNTLICFNVGELSYHSVEDMHGNWTRKNISIDWRTKKKYTDTWQHQEKA